MFCLKTFFFVLVFFPVLTVDIADGGNPAGSPDKGEGSRPSLDSSGEQEDPVVGSTFGAPLIEVAAGSGSGSVKTGSRKAEEIEIDDTEMQWSGSTHLG